MGHVQAIELGCPGHFIASSSCRWRRHTQIERDGVPVIRVSTVGDYFAATGDRQTLGASPDSFFETMVFRLTGKPDDDNDGCGCAEVADWGGEELARYATAGAAQRGHEAMVQTWRAKA